MNQKYIGIALLMIALYFSYFVYESHQTDLRHIREKVDSGASCISEEGICLHEQASNAYLIGGIVSFSLFLMGIYLTFFDRTQKFMEEHQIKISRALEESKRLEKDKDEFKAYLAGFKEDEQKVLKAVHEQDGIQQSTLRYRTAMSKTSLSLLLKDLESRQIISRKLSGKTNEVYLVKKF